MIDFDYERELAFNAALAETLAQLQPRPEVAEFVLGLEDNRAKGRVMNALRRDPDLSLDMAVQIAGVEPQRRRPTPLENYESLTVVPAGTEKSVAHEWMVWMGNQLVKNRVRPIGIREIDQQPLFAYNFGTGEFSLTDNVSRQEHYVTFEDQHVLIWDWYAAESPELASYSWAQAFAAARAWHETCSLDGGALAYQEGTQNVVYKWPDGWTIREVRPRTIWNAKVF